MENWFLALGDSKTKALIKLANDQTEKFGLTLSEEDVTQLLAARTAVLTEQRRIEFGEGILPSIIYAFCDSNYLNQHNYADSLSRLQEIFYLYKNEMQDEITDEELLNFMREQFDAVAFGDLDYLEGTCLDVFAHAIRAGYREHHYSDGKGEYDQFDFVKRWDRELFLLALEELIE